MDKIRQIHNLQKYCLDLSDGQPVQQWIKEYTSNITIKFFLYQAFLNSFFTPINDTHYRWCGPLLIYAEHFTKATKTRAIINRPSTPEELISLFFSDGVEAMPDIALFPIRVSLYYRILSSFPTVKELLYKSHYYTFENAPSILAKTKIGNEHMLKEFNCFDIKIYYCIFASIIMMSSVICIHQNSLKAWMQSFWNNLSILSSVDNDIPSKTLVDKWMCCPWLWSCFILLAAFSGMLRNQILEGEQIHWIDSLDDIKDWKRIMKLQYLELGDFHNYITNNKQDVTISYLMTLKQECFTFTLEGSLDKTCTPTLELDYQGVISGTTALVFNERFINVVRQVLFERGLKENIDYHVSQPIYHSLPIFTGTNKVTFDEHYEKTWDKVITNILESNIFNYILKITQNPSRIGPDPGEKTLEFAVQVDPIKVINFRPMFILFLSFESSLILILLLEKFVFR